MRRLASLLPCAMLWALSCGNPYESQQALASSIAQALVDACPPAAPEDEGSWRRCSEALTDNALLREHMADPFIWGQQSRLWEYNLDAFHATRFNPRVFRRMYLSLFTFPSGFTVEQAGERTVIHMPIGFRSGLDSGVYPYPFWHNPNKWRDYHLATELLLIVRNGRIEGALRSAVRLLNRPRTYRNWDGLWRWDNGNEPHVTLYRELFSTGNPHVEALDRAYRALESGMREHTCMVCHSPDNSSQMHRLVLLVYPAQALESRATLAPQIEQGLMPPATERTPAGIEDPAERAELARLAREFRRIGDLALAYERERTTGSPTSP